MEQIKEIRECPECKGTGEKRKETCRDCSGKGKIIVIREENTRKK